jgi:hypothetical protein
MRDEESLERLVDLGCQSPRRVVPRPCHRTTVLSHPVALLHTAHCTLHTVTVASRRIMSF